MINKVSKNIIIPKSLIKKEGVVVLSLEEYERIKEDLEMLQSKKLVKEIKKARKEVKKIPLEKLLKENNL
ncbi:MAG TPA: hypothetical protein ENH06_01715 [bacterium]|nr:hypothetical protein [bacterium]